MQKSKLKVKIQNYSSGFTLIELLIVIVIIGVLATVFVSNYLGVRQKANDSQRKSNLRQIHAALELYRYNQGIYPSSLQSCPTVSPTYLGDPTCTVTYMQKIPTDPKGTSYYNGGNYYYTAPGGTSYTLCACLENTNDTQGAANTTCGTIAYSPPVISAPSPRLGFFSRIANLVQESVSLGKKEVSGLFSKLASLVPKSGTPKTSVIPQAAAATSYWTVSYQTGQSYISSLTFDSFNKVIYAGSGNNGIIYRCPTSTGCTSSANWTVSFSIPGAYIGSLTFDSFNKVIYAGTSNNGTIYRCATSTGCTSSANWTVSYQGPVSSSAVLTFDSLNGVIYAGLGNLLNSPIYRCATSTGCTSSANWSLSYTTTEPSISSLTFDSSTPNGVIYAGSVSNNVNGTIYRCATSTGCTSSANWTVSYQTGQRQINSLTFDSLNGVIYAGVYNNSTVSYIYSCATSTGCTSSANWIPFYLGPVGSYIGSLTFDSSTPNGVIYAGVNTGNGTIYRCPTSSICTVSYSTTESAISSLAFDSFNGVIYAGTGNNGIIYRCDTLTGCTAPPTPTPTLTPTPTPPPPTPTPTPPPVRPCTGKFFFLQSQ